MRKIISVITISLGLVSLTVPARADVAVGAGFSTLGYGVHLSASMTDFFALRFNGNFGDMDIPGAELMGSSFGGIDYDVDASFGTYGLVADFHPMALSPVGAGIVFSGGVYYNDNEFTFTADPLNDVQIGGQTLPGGSARIISKMTFDTKWAPYVGLGYDGTFQGILPVSFFFTGGVLFQGSPSVTMTETSGTITQSNLDAGAAQLENDASSFKYYPVVALGMTISF
jgi:hypothetical protein